MKSTSEVWQIGGRSVSVSNLDKIVWPEDDLTKRDMLRYEVEDGRLHPSDLTLRIVPERVRQVGDLLAPVLREEQRLP